MFTIKLISIFDILFAFLLLTLLLPLIILISILNYIIQGSPIFFISKRVGKDGKNFNIIKFRTYIELKNEKKISSYGKYLRRLSLDELPQIFNILNGDMSFVGPRPIPKEVEDGLDYKFILIRRKLKSGFTGLSQINYIGKKRSWEEKLLLDIKMIKKFSISFYFIILFKTPIVLIRRFRYNKDGDSL